MDFIVGAKKMYGTFFHVSPEGVKHMDMLNNLFARLQVNHVRINHSARRVPHPFRAGIQIAPVDLVAPKK